VTTTAVRASKPEPLLPPFPDGWYAVALSDELAPGQLTTRRLFGTEILVYRTASGVAAALDTTCPHLGAHLGHGGKVCGEAVRCPFHGFEFGTDGRCVAVPAGVRVPKRAQARAWSVSERNGLVLVWSGAASPTWAVPAIAADGWTPLDARVFTLRGHPQETSENSVDIGHFAVVHGFDDVEVTAPLAVDGPYLRASYAFTHPLALGRGVNARFTAHLWGLGYSLVDVEIPAFGLRSRNWVLATPTDGEHIELRLAVSVSGGGAVADAVARLLRPLVLRGFVHDTAQDFEIWRHKRYVNPPALAEGDGPIGRYRAWARQFYAVAPAG
jgi:nitrite reductase/ring-hydroxylating ferredoxin subunit